MKNIIASYWTIAGDIFPECGNEVSSFSFAERMEVAAAVGFRGAGFVLQDLNAVKSKIGLKEMARILSSNGLVEIEVEILTNWFATDAKTRKESDEARRDLLDAAEQLGARHIKIAGEFSDRVWPVDHMAKEFATLCVQAKEVGARVGIEVMPFTNLATLDDAMAVVKAAGADNGGLLLDIWHIERGGIDLNEIGRLPRGSIVSIEINDALSEVENGDLWHDTLHNRVLPGEGCFNLQKFLHEVAATGYEGPAGIEILSKTHRKLHLREAAERAIKAARKFYV